MYFKAALVTTGLLAAGSALAQGNTAVWDVYRASAGGNGCPPGTVQFIANGNDLSIIFSALGVDMPGGSYDQVLAQVRNCKSAVPVTIARGLYLAELRQQISYGVTKTAGSRGAISTRNTFFNRNVSPYTIQLPYGYNMLEPLRIAERRDRFLVDTQLWPNWLPQWCSLQRAPQGLFTANTSVAGQRDSSMEDLIVSAQGFDVRFEVTSAIQFCPAQ